MTIVSHPYPMARAVASLLHERFAGEAERSAATPAESIIEEIIDVAFWASLRREEGRSPKISLTWLPRGLAPGNAVTFARPLPFDAPTLSKLAPAVEQPGIHLLIEQTNGRLEVWGTSRRIPPGSLVLEVIEAGLLVVKRRRSEGSSKYANVMVLEGDQIKIVDESRVQALEHRPFITHFLSLDSNREALDPANVTIQLAASMRAHRRGGSLLIVPVASDEWKESVVQPVRYEVAPPHHELASLLEQRPAAGEELLWRERMRRGVDEVAGMTAVDGATVMDERYAVLAFGAKIRRRRTEDPIQQVLLTRVVHGVGAAVVNVSELGGTRHLSAAQFANDQRDALALVASQDGNFTAFAWAPTRQMVAAYSLETLLL